MSIAVRASLLLGLFVIACLPGLAYARKGSSVLNRAPLITASQNSQTMALLEAPHNYDPLPKVGGHLAIVDNSALSAGTDSETFTDGGIGGSGQISVYIVRKGDTLSSIAQMFNVTTNTIVWANDLKSRTVKEGTELVILPITGVKYTVKTGDTVKSIAAKYKADVNDILSYNDVSLGSALKAGDTLIIPDGDASMVVSTPTQIKKSNKGVTKISSGLPEFIGYFMKPVNAVKTQGLHGHNGIDFGGPIGTPIKAAASGIVTVSRIGGYNGGYGTYVVISHPNGTQTLYGHMSEDLVNVGQSVTQGEVIGAIGNTGKSTGPHLHFEVRGGRNPF